MDYINAFWVGGLICALTQILLDRTKLMPGRIMVLLVCSGSVLGALKIYPAIQEYAGAGASRCEKQILIQDPVPAYHYWDSVIFCGKVSKKL